MKILIDSSAWVEYLEGSNLGVKIRELILGEEELLSTPTIIAEVISNAERSNHNTDLIYKIIIGNTSIINLDAESAKEAGILHAKLSKESNNFGLGDAIILVSARKIGAKIITKDKHFKNCKEAIIL